MDNDKVNFLIDIIKDMDIKNKLRLAIRMNESNYTNLVYNKAKMFNYFDNLLKEIDKTYKMSYINFNKYPIIRFAMAKIMEMDNHEQNKTALFLFNKINFEISKEKKNSNIIEK